MLRFSIKMAFEREVKTLFPLCGNEDAAQKAKKEVFQDGKFPFGLNTSAQQQNNGGTYDGKSVPSAQIHPSIITKSSADLILSMKRCRDAICHGPAARHAV